MIFFLLFFFWGSFRGPSLPLPGPSGPSSSSSWTEDSFELNVLLESSDGTETSRDSASVNQQPVIPELHPPLLSDNTRQQELNNRLGFYWLGMSYNPEVRDSFVRTQLLIERHIEAALVDDGYSRESVLAKRDQMRGFLFYPTGSALSESTYKSHLDQILENGTRQSVPYRRVCRAIKNLNLFLE